MILNIFNCLIYKLESFRNQPLRNDSDCFSVANLQSKYDYPAISATTIANSAAPSISAAEIIIAV